MPYLDPYSGNFTETEARHLLRRTVFGPTQSMVETAAAQGLAATIVQLFTALAEPQPPVKSIPDSELEDPACNYGDTWVNGPPFPNVNPPILRNRIIRQRFKSMYAWTFLQMQYSGMSIQEKLALFWHNHFVVGNSQIPTREYVYYKLLRSHALGNFKTLVKEITVDTNMLLYLSGSENTKNAPNENYSRELLELFTIGKGPLVGPGDYTNYAEEDVESMARVLTGWRVPPVSNPDTLTAHFDSNKHTSGSKTLSHRFGNATITENGDQEYKDLIEVIFQQDECARFIARKLYRWFVNSEIDSDLESNIIEPLAQEIIAANYNISPALKTLLQSDHFFESTACMIKTPVDLILSASRALGIEPPQNEVEDEYNHAYNYYIMCADLEQALFQHPNVAGWKAFYQEPQLDKLWVNNLLLPKRHTFCQLMVEGGTFSYNDANYQVTSLVPVLGIADSISGADDPNTLVNSLASRLFNYSITTDQVESLKDVLIPGLPDFEWTVEYNSYKATPGDQALKESVENKLRNLLSIMVRMSEFQIM